MSKNHRENRKPKPADWIVRTTGLTDATIISATFIRDDHGGYAFTDSSGIVADYPPGTVLNVTRRDREPVFPYGTPEPLGTALASYDGTESLDSRA